EARADTDFEHSLARLERERLEQGLAPGLQHGAEHRIVDAGVAAVRRLHRFDMHRVLSGGAFASGTLWPLCRRGLVSCRAARAAAVKQGSLDPERMGRGSKPRAGYAYCKPPFVPMKIAQIAPLAESVPPRLYGGTERVVSYLTEE